MRHVYRELAGRRRNPGDPGPNQRRAPPGRRRRARDASAVPGAPGCGSSPRTVESTRILAAAAGHGSATADTARRCRPRFGRRPPAAPSSWSPWPAGLERLDDRATRDASRGPTAAALDADGRDLDEPLPVETGDLLAAMVGWAAPYATLADLAEALERHRRLVAELRRDDANLTLATAHSTKGLEFDHVAVIGLDAGRFPSARSLRDAPEPARSLEEERRLAYVAWTRARRSLTLVYDPASPSQFLLEAFSEAELCLDSDCS